VKNREKAGGGDDPGDAKVICAPLPRLRGGGLGEKLLGEQLKGGLNKRQKSIHNEGKEEKLRAPRKMAPLEKKRRVVKVRVQKGKLKRENGKYSRQVRSKRKKVGAGI